MKNTQIVREVNGQGIHKEVKYKYCRKCFSLLLDGTNDGFCKDDDGRSFCRREYFACERKLAEEVYEGMRYGDR